MVHQEDGQSVGRVTAGNVSVPRPSASKLVDVVYQQTATPNWYVAGIPLGGAALP